MLKFKYMNINIDIIIPIYNSYENVKKCIQSVINHTDLKNNRLIIIDDRSNDNRVFDLYKKIEKNENNNIRIYRNKENLGFVGTVNRGMGLNKKNDVLLLNSDTIVSKNWLTKIIECAYSSDDIATVTPLSNNATICSVPNFVEDNVIPDGFDIDSFANLIEITSLKIYPNLPTAHGFCMFIKREVLDIFGLFNFDLFGKGYGEENEFCLRVEKYGYKNVLDDSTFIYHSGCASFTDAIRINKVKNNLKIIEKLYPGYQERIDKFVKTNPLKPIHDNINFWIKKRNLFYKNKKRVLFVMHYEPSIGGVGINTNQVCDNSSGEFDFYLFTTNSKGEVIIKVREKREWVTIWNFKNKNSDLNSFKNEEIENIFDATIEYLKIDVVHFQHLMGLPLSLLTIPKLKNIKSILSLHDYYLISSSPQYIGCEDLVKFKFTSDGIKDGKKLLEGHYSFKNNGSCKTDVYRLEYLKKYFNSIDLIISPSKYVKDLYSTVMDIKKIKIIIQEHGISIKKTLSVIPNDKKIVIAYLGVASHHKGFEDFVLLIQKSREKKIKWLIVGYISQEWLTYLNENKILEKFDVELTGTYDLNLVQEVLFENKVDLIVLPSIFPETYSYTLSEAIQSNIPVIARDIGALGDRVKSNNYGWIYKDRLELVEIVHKLCTDIKIVKDKKIYLKDKVILGVEEMALFYKNKYEKFALSNHNDNYKIDVTKINRLFGKAAYDETNIGKEISYNTEIVQNKKNLKMIIKNIPILGKIALNIKRAVIDKV